MTPRVVPNPYYVFFRYEFFRNDTANLHFFQQTAMLHTRFSYRNYLIPKLPIRKTTANCLCYYVSRAYFSELMQWFYKNYHESLHL